VKLAPAIEGLLAPQRRFDALRRATVPRAGARLADLAYANAYGQPADEVVTALRRALESAGELGLQYTPYGGATVARRQVAEQLEQRSGLAYGFRGVVLTPGAMAALNLVFRALRELGPGGEVIVPVPCWLDYPLYLENLGLVPRFVAVDPLTLRLDFAAIARALNPATVGLLLMQPANPSGVRHDVEELHALADLLQAAPQPVLLISDESHRDVRLDDEPLVSPATLWARTVVIHSFGKSLQIQGQRIGYVAVPPEMPERLEFIETLETLCRVMGFCTPTALMQLALGELLAYVPDWSALQRRRGIALEALRAGGYEVVPSQATFFLYPRTPGGEDWAHAEQLAAQGVLVLPAPVFHHRGHFRLALTCSDEMLERAATVFARGGRP
jgi:aspartate aminotransferase